MLEKDIAYVKMYEKKKQDEDELIEARMYQRLPLFFSIVSCCWETEK